MTSSVIASQDMLEQNVMFAMITTTETQINLAAHAKNVTATITSMLEDLEIVMLEQENAFNVCMKRLETIANIVKMDFTAML